MTTPARRGSEKLLDAWKARTISEESFRELAAALEKSPANVDGAFVTGGSAASGLYLSLRYDGDDVPRCGNDLEFILRWINKHHYGVSIPRIIINGTPRPDLFRMDLQIGAAVAAAHVPAQPDIVPGF